MTLPVTCFISSQLSDAPPGYSSPQRSPSPATKPESESKRRRTSDNKMVAGRQNDVSWPWHIRQTGKGADVIVRVDDTDFRLHKVFLENGSEHFEKLFEAAAAESININGCEFGPVVVELPAFPRGADTFSVAMDYCYGKVDQEIDESNVEDLIAANNFLQVEILGKKIYKFLEENAFVTPEKCLLFLSKLKDESVQDALANICKTAFLASIKVPCPFESPDSSDLKLMFCNVTSLPQVGKMLPPYRASEFYKSIVDEQLSLFFKVDSNSPVAIKIPLSSRLKVSGRRSSTSRPNVIIQDFDPNVFTWMRKLPDFLPDVIQRSLLLKYLAEAARIEPDVTVSVNFLCSLLVEMTRLSALEGGDTTGMSDVSDADLREEIDKLETEVGKYMNYLNAKALFECEHSTLLSVVKHFSKVEDDPKNSFCTNLDGCLRDKLRTKSFTVQQVLHIYEHFPHHIRDKSGHSTLFSVFEDVLRAKSMSIKEKHELSCMLDFDKLPDRVVERLFQGFDIGYEPPLLRRSMEIMKQKCMSLSPKGKSGEDREQLLIFLQIIQCCILMVKQNHVLMETVGALCKKQGLQQPIFQDEVASMNAPCTIDLEDDT